MADDTNVGSRVANAVGEVVKKIEAAADVAVTKIEDKARETINKLDRAAVAVTAPFHAADKMLDDLIGGHNGGPALDDTAPFQNTVAGVVGDAKPGTSTAASPQTSALGVPTGGVTASDVAK